MISFTGISQKANCKLTRKSTIDFMKDGFAEKGVRRGY